MKRTKKILVALACLILAVTLVGAISIFAAENTAEPGSKGEIQVWLIAGQSNAVGYAEDTPEASDVDTRYTEGFENVLFFGQGGGTLQSTEFLPLTLGNGKDKRSHGPEIGIASALGNSGEMHAVIKSAFGGTAIYPKAGARTWTSPSYVEYLNGINSDDNPDNNIPLSAGKSGALYTEFVNTVTEGLELLIAEGYTPVIRGMWWMQGEAETGADEYAVEYERLLTCLINDMRADLAKISGDSTLNSAENPMPVVLGKIYRNPAYDSLNPTSVANVPVVTAAQAAVASALNNVSLVDSSDCYGFYQQDSWHYSSEAQMHMGEQFVATVLKAENKYLVTSDGVHTIINTGLYPAGSRVEVVFTAQTGYEITKVTMKIGNADPIAIELTDGTYIIDSMPEAEVRFNISTLPIGATETTIADYGVIPKEYYLASDYPIVLFNNGSFVDVCDNFTVDAMEKIAAAGDGSVLVIRADYDMSKEKAGVALAGLNGSVVIDLLGNTISMGTSVSADGLIKCDATNLGYTTNVTMKNGKILMGEDPVVRFSAASSRITEEYVNGVTANPKDAQRFNVTFEELQFGLDKRHSDYKNPLMTAYQDVTPTNRSISVCTLTLRDCSFDFGNNTDALNIFSTSNIDVTATLIGGSIKADNIGCVTFDSMNGVNSVLALGPNDEGKYTSVIVPQNSSVPTNIFRTVDGDAVAYVPVGTENGYWVCDIASQDISTPYGKISDAYISVDQYPWIVFDTNGNCVGGYINYANDAIPALTASGDGAVLYLRRNYSMEEAANINIKDGLSQVDGTVTIDLGNNTVTMGKGGSGSATADSFLKGEACMLDAETNIILKNGTVKLGEDPFLRFDTAPSDKNANNRTNEEYVEGYNADPTRAQKITFIIDGLTLLADDANSSASAILMFSGISANFTTTEQKKAKSENSVVFKNCTIDLGNTEYTTEKKFFNVASSLPSKAIFEGGVIKAVNMNKLSFGSAASTRFNEDADGRYTLFEFADSSFSSTTKFASASDPSITDLIITKQGENNGSVYYTLMSYEKSIMGHLPESAAAAYPLSVYTVTKSRYVYFGSYEDYHAALTAIMNGTDDATMVLRRDYEYNAISSWANIGKIRTLNIDLCGYTMTDSSTHKYGLIYFSMKQEENVEVTFRNGNLILGSRPVASVYADGSNTVAGQTTAKLVLDNVNISYKASATGVNVLVQDNQSTASKGSLNVEVVLNDTVIDLTNAKSGVLLFNADMCTKAPTISFNTSIVMNGGKIIANSMTSFKFSSIREGSSVVFDKGSDGYYPVISLPSDAEEPVITVALGNQEGVFVKISDNEITATYRLTPKAVAEQNFVPKTSITLGSEFVYNVYVPVSDILDSFTIDDNTFENLTVVTLDDGDQYYHVSIPLPASSAARNIVLKATITIDGKTYNGTWTMSIPKYAKKVLDSYANNTEKTLVKDALVYIKEAYNYVGFASHNTTGEIARVNALIESVIGDYQGVPVSIGTTSGTAGVTSVTVNLDAKPTIRFYVTDTSLEFFANGVKLDTVTDSDEYGTYIELDVYAYVLAETITFGDGGSYHISSFVNGSSDQPHEALVKAFVKYVESAANYRAFVIGNNK